MILLKGGIVLEQGKNDNIWLYKSSIIFVKKLMRNNMINQQEYNTTVKRLAELYNITPTTCTNTYKGVQY
jgi:hypothetical protein